MSPRISPVGRSRGFLCLALLAAALAPAPAAPAPSPAELARARAFAAAKFTAQSGQAAFDGELVIAEGKGPLLRNAAPGGPLELGGHRHDRGLYAGGVTRLTVRLPAPAATFEATVGLQRNWWGRNDLSEEAVFAVATADRPAGARAHAALGAAGVPLHSDLAGAREFTLTVENPGEAPARKTAIWADARVTLQDGRVVWLDELPVSPTPLEWTQEPPVAFTYAGRDSREFLSQWPAKRATRRLDAQRTEHRVTHRDPKTGLAVQVVAVEYHEFAVVEWTAYLENTGTADTPIIADLRALDLPLTRNDDGEFVLHHHQGSLTTPTDYRPFATTLAAGARKDFVSEGRPTSQDLCYFNLQWPASGVIVALGWPGQWSASFVRDDARGLRVQAGQARTHFKLHPGERARTPLVALQFWDGDKVRSQNLWRRWMLAHNTLRPGGQPLKPSLWACFNSLHEDYAQIDEKKNIEMLDRLLAAGVKLDIWEMDAGWYVNNGRWQNTGTWEPDPKRFPQGLRPLLDHVHAKGLKTHIWFEPERVTRGTWLWENRPEWLLSVPEWESSETPPTPRRRQLQDSRLLDLGNPAAYRWMVDMLDRYIGEGIDIYRTDFNIDPLPFWQAADAAAPERVGLTENKYVVGFLAYFDELARRHPGLLLDTCASGGRRNDLETLRRAIPVTRSDYFAEPAGCQNITYGIASWIPLYGTGTVGNDTYTNRSAWGPWPGLGWYLRDADPEAEKLRRMSEECRSLMDYFYGDYYPLTPYDTSNAVWMAWQFDRPDLGTGMIQVFRRADSPHTAAEFTLGGLQPDATYEFTPVDEPAATFRMTGRELMERGLPVSIPRAPTALILTYRIHPGP